MSTSDAGDTRLSDVATVSATNLLIDGELVAGAGEPIDVLDPATAEVVAQVAQASDDQVDAAAAAAAAAFESYSRSTPAERSALLLDIAQVIDDNSLELAALESLDVGKPWPSAHDDEMPLTIDTYRFMAGAARTITGLAAGEYVEGHTSMIRRDPIGPVAAISPWNYPLMMASWKLAAPLAAGCTVVLKPSEVTPLATLRMAELLADVVPRGVINVIHGSGGTVGDRLINSPRIEAISVTGSPRTGAAAMRAAADRLRHVHLELGGKAPVIVFDDADLEAVVAMIREGSFYNAGQDCAQPCRIIAQSTIYDDLVARLEHEIPAITVGHPRVEGTEMGPMISAMQRESVAAFVNRARPSAEIITGGRVVAGAGFFYEPTLVADVDNDAELACEEVFGPVISVSRFTDLDDAVEIANRSRYGLASSVWTNDHRRAMNVTSRLRYGFTWVNTHGVATPEMPWAAMRASGSGSDMSVYSLEAYTAVRHVMFAH